MPPECTGCLGSFLDSAAFDLLTRTHRAPAEGVVNVITYHVSDVKGREKR